MSELVANCPRCGAQKITFTLLSAVPVLVRYNWQNMYEAFCVCRNCYRSTIFQISDKDIESSKFINDKGLFKIEGSVNDLINIEGFISLKDLTSITPPDHLPEYIRAAFTEGSTCLSVNCYNAAGAMFRLCIDLATKAFLPEGEEHGLTNKIRRSLGLRLLWLFDSGFLPAELRGLSDCIKEDGNDGAHDGSLVKEDAEDLLDFTIALLERLYTEPERLRIAQIRREKRRVKADPS